MQKHIKLLTAIVIALSLSACGGKSKKKGPLSKLKESVEQAKEIGETAKNYKKVADKAGEMQEMMEQLSEIEPMTQAELKEWFPTEIDGFKRTAYKGGEVAMLNIVSATGTYKEEDEDGDKSFTVEVTDGAGPTAGSIVSMFHMRMQMDMEEETESGYSRTVEKNGYKAEEKQNDRNNTSGLTFLEGQRFVIQMEGRNMTAEELWGVMNKLKFNKLP